MNIEKGQKIRLFDVKEGKAYARSVSTYEGKDKDGNAKYSNWYCIFREKAKAVVENLAVQDIVVLDNAKIESYYNKEKKEAFVSIVVFECHKDEGEEKPKATEPKEPSPEGFAALDEEIPF